MAKRFVVDWLFASMWVAIFWNKDLKHSKFLTRFHRKSHSIHPTQSGSFRIITIPPCTSIPREFFQTPLTLMRAFLPSSPPVPSFFSAASPGGKFQQQFLSGPAKSYQKWKVPRFWTSNFLKNHIFFGNLGCPIFCLEANTMEKTHVKTFMKSHKTGFRPSFQRSFIEFHSMKNSASYLAFIASPCPGLRYPLTWPKEPKHNPWKKWKKKMPSWSKKTEINTHRYMYIYIYIYYVFAPS